MFLLSIQDQASKEPSNDAQQSDHAIIVTLISIIRVPAQGEDVVVSHVLGHHSLFPSLTQTFMQVAFPLSALDSLWIASITGAFQQDSLSVVLFISSTDDWSSPITSRCTDMLFPWSWGQSSAQSIYLSACSHRLISSHSLPEEQVVSLMQGARFPTESSLFVMVWTFHHASLRAVFLCSSFLCYLVWCKVHSPSQAGQSPEPHTPVEQVDYGGTSPY